MDENQASISPIDLFAMLGTAAAPIPDTWCRALQAETHDWPSPAAVTEVRPG